MFFFISSSFGFEDCFSTDLFFLLILARLGVDFPFRVSSGVFIRNRLSRVTDFFESTFRVVEF